MSLWLKKASRVYLGASLGASVAMSVLFNVSDPRVNGSFVKPQVALYRHNRREGYTCILRLFIEMHCNIKDVPFPKQIIIKSFKYNDH